MAYQTKADILAKWETQESRQEAREIEAIKKDIATASKYLADALARYRKEKTRAKSKKAAEENPWAELEGYESRREIEDAYGWDFITEAKMDKLLELWDAREESAKHGATTVYRDRVTDMLERAARSLGNEYQDQLFNYQQRQAIKEREAETVARENNERTRRREFGEQI